MDRESIILLYLDKVKHMAEYFCYTRGMNELKEDMIQESYIGLMKIVNEIDLTKSSLSTYINNKIPWYLKDVNRRDNFLIIKGERVPKYRFTINIDDYKNSTELAVDGIEGKLDKKRIVARILSFLSEEEALMMTMYYYEEFSFQDMADHLGMSSQTICNKMKKIKEKLIENKEVFLGQENV